MKKWIILLIILAVLCAWAIVMAGEKEELMGQKKYIEQKLTAAPSEFDGFIKAYQLQIQTWQNDLRNITQRLSQIEQEEKNPAKKEDKK